MNPTTPNGVVLPSSKPSAGRIAVATNLMYTSLPSLDYAE
jgi:hypothetical protein